VIPVSDQIENLHDWLMLPPEMRRDSAGAAVILGEIAASHANLLGALEALADVQNGPPLHKYAADWEAAMQKARTALAKARGA
jgi:hypothetical protein